MTSDSAGPLLLSLVAVPCAGYVVRFAWPPRRLIGESWLDLYFRVYFNPGNALFVLAFFVARVFGLEILGEHSTEGIYLAALVWLAILTGATARNREILEERRRERRQKSRSPVS